MTNSPNKREITQDDINLAKRIAHSMYPGINETNPLYNECESAALLGLVQAANNYDPEQDKTWPYYRYIRITGSIIDAMRRERDQCHAGLTGRGRNSEEDTLVTMAWDADILSDIMDNVATHFNPEEALLRAEQIEIIMQYIESCSIKEAVILLAVWLHDVPTSEVATKLKCKQRYVQWILTKHKPKILKHMQKYN